MNGRIRTPLEDEHHRLLDQFEDRWLGDGETPDVLAFCHQLPESARRGDLLLQLASTDLELRVRLGRGESLRSAGWYLRKLRPFGLDTEFAVELAVHELVVRSFWGDRPRIDGLIEQQFPKCSATEHANLAARYRWELDQRFPVSLQFSNGPLRIYRTVLRSTNEIGRQRHGEPDPPASYLVPNSDVTRILIAGRQQNSISRRQLRLLRAGVDCVELVPLSESVSTYINKSRLRLAQASCHEIPLLGLEVRFHEFVLKLRRT